MSQWCPNRRQPRRARATSRAPAGSAQRLDDQVETGRVDESAKIPIAGDERNAVVDARLRNQGIAKPRLAARTQHDGAELASPPPESLGDLEQGQFGKCRSDIGWQLR